MSNDPCDQGSHMRSNIYFIVWDIIELDASVDTCRKPYVLPPAHEFLLIDGGHYFLYRATAA